MLVMIVQYAKWRYDLNMECYCSQLPPLFDAKVKENDCYKEIKNYNRNNYYSLGLKTKH